MKQQSLHDPRSKTQIQTYYKQFLCLSQCPSFKQLLKKVPQSVLRQHRVKILEKEGNCTWSQLVKQGCSYVELAQTRHGGLDCDYNVVIGNFFMVIRVLNLHRNSQQLIDNTDYLGEGSFGVVKRLKIGQKETALKKINFSYKKHSQLNLSNIIDLEDFGDANEIKKAISEYCIYKICSMFQIGPQIIFQQTFDLVCFNDCIEFQMELCELVGTNVDFKSYQRDIKRCLSILHAIKFIHKDIKKENTLYSPTFKCYVLSDFGLTHSVKEQIWQETQTYFGGSPTHASPQMKQLLFHNECGYVNLYLNDLHCLQVTLSQLQSSSRSQQFQQNSMSFGHDYEDSCSIQFSQQNYGESIGGSSQRQQAQGIASSTMLTPIQSTSSLQLTGTQSTCNTQSELSADRINYYQIKILSKCLPSLKQMQSNSDKQFIEQLLLSLVNDANQYQQFRPEILRLTLPIINSVRGQLLKFTCIRNSIRVLGISHEETLKQLEQLSKTRDLDFVNFQQLDNYLSMARGRDYNKFAIKKFKNLFVNMDRHLCLRNRKSLLSSLWSLCKDFINKGQKKQEEKIIILSMGLEVIASENLSESEHKEVLNKLAAVLTVNETKSDQISGQSCLELVNRMFKYVELKSKETLMMLQNMIKIHILYNSSQAKDYYIKVVEKRKEIENKILESQQPDQRNLKSQLLKYGLCQICYFIQTRQIQTSLELAKKYYQDYLNFQIEDSQLKIGFLDKIISGLTKMNKFDEAEIYNQVLYEEVERSCFPQKNCVEFAFYYSYKGLIELGRNKPSEAMANFELTLECTNDALRGPNYAKLIRQTLTNLSVCYSKMCDETKALQCLQKALQFSVRFEYNRKQQSIKIIHQIIVLLIKNKKLDSQLSAFSDQLASLKIQLMQSNRINLTLQKQKVISFFPFELFDSLRVSKQSLIFAKKTMMVSVQPYLPRFKNWYLTTCEDLANYYLGEANSITKALPFYWKYFNCIPKSERTEALYEKMDSYVELLIQTNSSRRALKFLKEYTPHIPETLESVRAKAYVRLMKLSQQLNTQDKLFYQMIAKNPIGKQDIPEESLQLGGNSFLKHIYKKKMELFFCQDSKV